MLSAFEAFSSFKRKWTRAKGNSHYQRSATSYGKEEETVGILNLCFQSLLKTSKKGWSDKRRMELSSFALVENSKTTFLGSSCSASLTSEEILLTSKETVFLYNVRITTKWIESSTIWFCGNAEIIIDRFFFFFSCDFSVRNKLPKTSNNL